MPDVMSKPDLSPDDNRRSSLSQDFEFRKEQRLIALLIAETRNFRQMVVAITNSSLPRLLTISFCILIVTRPTTRFQVVFREC